MITNKIEIVGRGTILIAPYNYEHEFMVDDIVPYEGIDYIVTGIESHSGLLSTPVSLVGIGLKVKEYKL